MALPKSIPLAKLRDKLPPEEIKRNETTYQSSRGGWFPAPDKPVPGTPQE